MATRRVILHIGPTKTGTSTIQRLIWKNQQEIRNSGVFLPGNGQPHHFRIGNDIRGRSQPADHYLGRWARAYDRAIRDFRRSNCHTMLITDETMAPIPTKRVERALAKLDDFEVEIVYGMRDLAAMLPSQWQMQVRHSIAQPLDEWLDDVRDHNPGNLFWRGHDPEEVLRRWSANGSHRVHLVVVPKPGAPRAELWRRFEAATGWSARTDSDAPSAQESLGLVEADLMRRIQGHFVDGKVHRRRPVLAKAVVRRVLTSRPGQVRILLPKTARDWVDMENQRQIEYAVRSDAIVHGDLEDLRTDELRFGDTDIEAYQAEELDAAVAAIASLTEEVIAARAELRKANMMLGQRPNTGILATPTAPQKPPSAGTYLRLAAQAVPLPVWLRRPAWVRRPRRH